MVEQGDPLPPVEKGIERDLLQLHVVEGVCVRERERGGLSEASGESVAGESVCSVVGSIVGHAAQARRPSPQPIFLAQPKHGPARRLAGPGWPGPEQQAVPGPDPKHVGRHGMACYRAAGPVMGWPASAPLSPRRAPPPHI